MKVSVIGAAGYVGGELLRILLQHPEVSECIATSRSQAGKPIGDVHPGLAGVTDARFAGLEAGEASRERDVVFLALEHGESSRLAGAVIDAGPGLIVDLAADFRVRDRALYERYYGAHEAPDLMSSFVYGLADVAGPSLRGARAIAAPGCFATAAQLALYPLARLAEGVPALFAVTGSSGAGVHPKPTTHHPARAHNLFAYSVMSHRHDAEVLGSWREWTGNAAAKARLMVHAGPFVRGIYLTMHAMVPAGVAGSVRETYAAAYRDRPFVRVLPGIPELTHAVGSNDALIGVMAGEDGAEVQVMVAIDNLIKGAGGQAVQAMNLALGIEETAGLRFAGMYPC